MLTQKENYHPTKPFLLLLNAQGFIKHKDEIKNLVIRYKPRILCLTETHIKEEIEDEEINIINYEIARCNTKNGRTGGVINYIRQDIKYKVICNKSVEENLWINAIKIGGEHNEIVVCTIYHSPNKSDGKFIELITEECENLIQIGHVILLGDFNIDVSKSNQYTNRLMKNMNNLGLKQYVTEYTRITEHTKTKIDLAFLNDCIWTNVLETPRITDHQIIEIKLNTIEHNKERNTNREIYVRVYTTFTEENFCNKLSTIMKDSYDATKDTNLVAYELIQHIVEAINTVAPQITKSLPLRWKEKPWITKEVRRQSEERDKAYKIAKCTNTHYDWDMYKEQRNRTVQVIRKSTKVYYEQNIDKRKSNPTEMWKTIKELLGNKKKIINAGTKEITFKGKQYKDEKIIADEFNEFFLQSIEEIICDEKKKQRERKTE